MSALRVIERDFANKLLTERLGMGAGHRGLESCVGFLKHAKEAYLLALQGDGIPDHIIDFLRELTFYATHLFKFYKAVNERDLDGAQASRDKIATFCDKKKEDCSDEITMWMDCATGEHAFIAGKFQEVNSEALRQGCAEKKDLVHFFTKEVDAMNTLLNLLKVYKGKMDIAQFLHASVPGIEDEDPELAEVIRTEVAV